MTEDHANIQEQGHPNTIYLANLRRQVESAPVGNRPAVLDRFLRAMASRASDEGHTLEEVRNRLMPRIGLPFSPILEEIPPFQVLIPGRPEEKKTAKDPGQGTVVAPNLDELQINLVVDEPETVWYVRQKHLNEWGTTVGELLPIALSNLRRRTSADRLRPIREVPGVLAYETGDSYDAARLLILKDIVAPWPREGVVAAVPIRDLLLCVRLDSLDALRVMNPAFGYAQHLASRGAYAITGHAVWYDGTAWEYVPTGITGKGINVYPSDRFVQALNRLGGSK